MIYIKENTLNRIANWKDDSIHILIDFDRTITSGQCEGSWSVFAKSNLLPNEYNLDRQELYKIYRPVELDENIDYETKSKVMHEWWYKHIQLLIKYNLSEEIVNMATENINVMTFREGVRDFFKNMYKRNIPVIIMSAGVGNFIEQFLIKNECNYSNIYVISNYIKFENGIATGVSKDIIHSLNKKEVSLPKHIKENINNRPNVILLGDSLSDIKMATDDKIENALKIGFLEDNVAENTEIYIREFDVVCTNNTSFNELSKKITILK